MSDNEQKLAVLIDADNISASYMGPMMEEIARYGTPTIKRIYGDWTSANASGWKKILLDYAVTPIQQYSYTSGKNSTDSAMIIDAMDLLYSGNVTGFCIVSSDSDFTRLATRLREAGMLVIGIGDQKTPQPFIASCDRFIYLEIISPKDDNKSQNNTKQKKKTLPQKVVKLIAGCVNDVADENGWAFLGDVGNMVLKKNSAFDSRNYGYSKLTPLIKSSGRFEIDQRDTSNRGIKHIYIKDREFDKDHGRD